MQPQGDRLLVRMHIPTSVLGEVPIQAAAADTVRTLDVRQDETPLDAPAITTTVSDDGKSVDVELTYRIAAGASGISARLNGFQSTSTEPVRTTVRYQPATGREQIMSVTGPATRVGFDPGTLDAVQLFTAQGLRSVLTLGDHVLLLLCLLIPLRTGRDAIRLMRALVAGQVAGIAVFLLFPGVSASWLGVTSMIAASFVVVASVQNIVRARPALVAALACGFGVLNGFAFGDALAAERQLAGSHQPLASVVFLLVLIVGQLWLAGVIWATRTWLDRRGLPERVAVLGVSAFIAHTAVHETIDRSAALATTAPGFADRGLLWLTLAWALVMLVVAAAEAMRHRRVSVA